MTNDTPTIVVAALHRALIRGTHRAHEYLTARGRRVSGKPVSPVGVALLARADACDNNVEALVRFIDGL